MSDACITEQYYEEVLQNLTQRLYSSEVWSHAFTGSSLWHHPGSTSSLVSPSYDCKATLEGRGRCGLNIHISELSGQSPACIRPPCLPGGKMQLPAIIWSATAGFSSNKPFFMLG